MERSFVSGLVLLALTAGALGCGGSEFANRPRPPATLNVTASIAERGITVDPQRFGAGPVRLIIANLSEEARELTIETTGFGGEGGGIEQSTGPINPGDTALLDVDLVPGRYEVSADGVGSVPVRVGPPRRSSQDQLLQP